jgi:hypothetical protein
VKAKSPAKTPTPASGCPTRTPTGTWAIAEVAANLLESAQLVPLRESPTRRVALMRRGPENRPALRTLLDNDIAALQPYANK